MQSIEGFYGRGREEWIVQYIYEPNLKNYEDLSSGRVLYNAPGATAFPVRLASEIIQRCFEILKQKGHAGPYSIYDPCCGGAYILTTIAMLHGQYINKLFASDIQPELIQLADKNLSLLTIEGMERRKEELQQLYNSYQKPSHLEALESVSRLARMVDRSNLSEAICFQRDITAVVNDNRLQKINIVISDVPYGDIVSWHSEDANPLDLFFANSYEALDGDYSVLAVIADKSQKIRHDQFKRIQHFKVGKRQVGIFEPVHR